ncbi:MAG: VLRF1 family aeRF1-type release factor [Solirubrobacterales bacterium]|nr:VLRF1 family aeRF1-type release factor [Solirubrobacterales bacterium]
MRNGLRQVLESAGDDRELHEVARRLGNQAERRLAETSAAERGRSVALFLGADESLDRLITFQIPFREDHVALDSGPVVWPMLDVIDRGLRTGLVLLSHDHIRLLEWRDGTAHDLEQSSWDLELGDWREYRGTARPGLQRGGQSISNDSAYHGRVEEWRARFFKAAAKAVAESARELEFDRLVIAADGDSGREFTADLPEDTRNLVQATVRTNLIDLSAAEAAASLDPHLRDAWRSRVNEAADRAAARIDGSDRAAAGADQVLLALAEGRVGHLLLDPYLEFSEEGLSDGARKAVDDAGEATVPEALVELAIRTDAQISSAAISEVPALEKGSGVLALLRY